MPIILLWAALYILGTPAVVYAAVRVAEWLGY